MLIGLAGGAMAQDAPPRLQPMTAGMLKALFPGRFEAIWKGDVRLTIGADAKGNLKGFANGKYDAGRWEVRGNKLCVSFTVWTDGDRKCSEVYRAGSWYVGLVNKKGNPNLLFRKQ